MLVLLGLFYWLEIRTAYNIVLLSRLKKSLYHFYCTPF